METVYEVFQSHGISYNSGMKKIYRSTTDKKIAGICGGLGEYTNTDSTLWRLVFILLLLPGGVPGLLLYIVMWIIVPEKPAPNRDNVVDV